MQTSSKRCSGPSSAAAALLAVLGGGCELAFDFPAIEPESGWRACSDGLDNDSDGLTDCGQDDSCIGTCPEPAATGRACSNGADDDGDGYTDLEDLGCLLSARLEVGETVEELGLTRCSTIRGSDLIDPLADRFVAWRGDVEFDAEDRALLPGRSCAADDEPTCPFMETVAPLTGGPALTLEAAARVPEGSGFSVGVSRSDEGDLSLPPLSRGAVGLHLLVDRTQSPSRVSIRTDGQTVTATACDLSPEAELTYRLSLERPSSRFAEVVATVAIDDEPLCEARKSIDLAIGQLGLEALETAPLVLGIQSWGQAVRVDGVAARRGSHLPCPYPIPVTAESTRLLAAHQTPTDPGACLLGMRETETRVPIPDVRGPTRSEGLTRRIDERVTRGGRPIAMLYELDSAGSERRISAKGTLHEAPLPIHEDVVYKGALRWIESRARFEALLLVGTDATTDPELLLLSSSDCISWRRESKSLPISGALPLPVGTRGLPEEPFAVAFSLEGEPRLRPRLALAGRGTRGDEYDWTFRSRLGSVSVEYGEVAHEREDVASCNPSFPGTPSTSPDCLPVLNTEIGIATGIGPERWARITQRFERGPNSLFVLENAFGVQIGVRRLNPAADGRPRPSMAIDKRATPVLEPTDVPGTFDRAAVADPHLVFTSVQPEAVTGLLFYRGSREATRVDDGLEVRRGGELGVIPFTFLRD